MNRQDAHEILISICKRLPEDYPPWGTTGRERGETWLADCSTGCRHYVPLKGRLGYDWGVCTNPRSHRVGLLTFEHQGCEQYESGLGR